MKQFLLLLMVAFTLGSCEIYDRVDELELTADALTKEDGYLSAALVEANIALADATALLEAAIAANAELTAENAALIAANMTEVDAQLAEIIASDELTAQEISDLEASVSVVKEDVMAYVDAQIDALQTELTAAIADGDEDAINKLQADIAAAIAAGLRGEDGADGEDGAQGPAGNDGAPGADGTGSGTGTAGPAGPQGETGPAGPKGDTGAQGEPGTNGTNGTNGLDAGDTGVDVIIYTDYDHSANVAPDAIKSRGALISEVTEGTSSDPLLTVTTTYEQYETVPAYSYFKTRTGTVSVVGIADTNPPVAEDLSVEVFVDAGQPNQIANEVIVTNPTNDNYVAPNGEDIIVFGAWSISDSDFDDLRNNGGNNGGTTATYEVTRTRSYSVTQVDGPDVPAKEANPADLTETITVTDNEYTAPGQNFDPKDLDQDGDVDILDANAAEYTVILGNVTPFGVSANFSDASGISDRVITGVATVEAAQAIADAELLAAYIAS